VHDALRALSIRTMVAAKQTEASQKLLDAIVLGNKSNFINTHFIPCCGTQLPATERSCQ